MELSDIDLLSRDVFSARVPHDWFAFLRREAPVYRHPEPDGPGFWAITKYDDIVLLNRAWEQNSSDQERGGVVGLEELAPDVARRQEELNAGGRMLITMDPPDHTQYRKLVNKGFTPRMIGALEPHIRELAAEIVEKAIARGECDFVVDVAAELPLKVIAELIGAPVEDRHKLFEWTNRMIESEDPEYIVDQDRVNDAFVEMYLYAQKLGAERRERPRDDIVTTLMNAEVDGDRLSEHDFNLFFVLLALAGNETTRNAISHGLHAFLEHPDQYQLLADDPSLSMTATEEILRWATPVMYFRRNVTQDYDIRGHHIAAGDKVSLWYISGNRDEDVFDDAFRFDILRDPNPHIAFGGGGPHFCLGASLARMEIKVLYEELAQRVPRIEALAEPARLRSNLVNGIKRLVIRLHAN